MQLHEGDFAELDKLGDEENARLSEADFVKRLLPYLVPPETTEKPRDLTIWLEAAGHAMRLIDVIDKDGTVLFTVPPILSRSPTSVPSKEMNPDNDLGEIGAIYDARIGTEPAHVVNDWYYSSLVQRSYSPEESLTYLYARMWITIYRRYNIPLERLFGDKADAIAGKVPDTGAQKKEEAKPVGGPENHDLDDDAFEAM